MRTLNVFWVACGSRGQNFGDWASEKIVHQVSGLPTTHVDVNNPLSADLVATGSVLHLIPDYWTGTIWGTGIIRDEDTFRFQNAHVCAVRGKLTAKRLGVDVPLGDPLLLWMGVKRPKFRLGIVPHYVDFDEPSLWEFVRRHDDVLVIDMLARDAAERIATCSHILSSALHGLVVADALGIPNLWTLFSENKIVGHGFKFRDYYTAFNLDDPIPYRFHPEQTLVTMEQRIEDHWQPRPLAQVTRDLITAFPDELRGELPSWGERSAMLGRLILGGSKVLDLGAGSQLLRSYLTDCSYQPCDVVLTSADTLPCDFNQGLFPQTSRDYDVVVAAGVLEYLAMPMFFIDKALEYGKTMLLTYAPKYPEQTLAERLNAGWVNHFTREELEDQFHHLGLAYEVVGQWCEQLIYRLSRP